MNWSLSLVIVVVALVLAPPPSPVHLSYATSGSMEPVIAPGDAYLLIDMGSYREGDIVTFYSATRSEHVTHRIVSDTAEGYLTQGDANPTTDQQAGLAPVPETAVLGRVLSIDEVPLILPGAGPAIRTVTTNPVLWGALVVVTGVLGVRSRGPVRNQARRVARFGDLVRPVFAVGVLGSLAVVLLLGSSTVMFQYVAVTTAPSGPAQVAVGQERNQSFAIQLTTVPIAAVFVEAEGMTVREQTFTDDTIRLNATVHARTAPGPFRTTVQTFAYPATLPNSVLASLHEWHPVAAAVASVGTLFGPLSLLYWFLFDDRVLVRPTTSRRLRRLLQGDR